MFCESNQHLINKVDLLCNLGDRGSAGREVDRVNVTRLAVRITALTGGADGIDWQPCCRQSKPKQL